VEVTWHLYLLRCADGALYTGIATDVGRRLGEHASGGARSARRLRGRGPLRLVYTAALGPRGLALRAERRLKALAKRDKETIVREQPSPCSLLAGLGLPASGAHPDDDGARHTGVAPPEPGHWP
jgi:putative endonuclease